MNTPLFITFHSTYTHIIIGLFQGRSFILSPENRDAGLIDEVVIDHKKASKTLLLQLEDMLNKHHKKLADCSFIAAHTGPGPFTTLRVLISSVNGLAYACALPLVGVDGLVTLMDEYYKKDEIVIALLNAFCNDVYYGIRTPNSMIMGCSSFEDFMVNIMPAHVTSPNPITLVGNGVSMYRDTLQTVQKAHFPDPLPQTCSLNTLALTALQHWYDKKNITDQLLPNYLKNSSAKINSVLVG